MMIAQRLPPHDTQNTSMSFCYMDQCGLVLYRRAVRLWKWPRMQRHVSYSIFSFLCYLIISMINNKANKSKCLSPLCLCCVLFPIILIMLSLPQKSWAMASSFEKSSALSKEENISHCRNVRSDFYTFYSEVCGIFSVPLNKWENIPVKFNLHLRSRLQLHTTYSLVIKCYSFVNITRPDISAMWCLHSSVHCKNSRFYYILLIGDGCLF